MGDEGNVTMERERKGVWVKSCPQLAGSGPSRFTSLLRHSLPLGLLTLLVFMVSSIR